MSAALNLRVLILQSDVTIKKMIGYERGPCPFYVHFLHGLIVRLQLRELTHAIECITTILFTNKHFLGENGG